MSTDLISRTDNTITIVGKIEASGTETITAFGFCWSTSNTPDISNSKTIDGPTSCNRSFTNVISGLSPGTTYYVRPYATNIAGTGYGEQVIVRTYDTARVKDIDGNVYFTVAIGTQVWMANNLKALHYRNGVPIPNVTDDSTWDKLTTSACRIYNNNPCYNWYSLHDSRNIAPAGWHIPTVGEWTTLMTYLNISHDDYDYQFSEIGFTADWGVSGAWWSSSEYDIKKAWFLGLPFYWRACCPSLDMTYKTDGLSVRCVKN